MEKQGFETLVAGNKELEGLHLGSFNGTAGLKFGTFHQFSLEFRMDSKIVSRNRDLYHLYYVYCQVLKRCGDDRFKQ